MSGVELMHDSVVGVGRCRQRVSASRSGEETTEASPSRNSRLGGEEKRQCEWAELGCLIQYVYKYLYSMVMVMRNNVLTAIGISGQRSQLTGGNMATVHNWLATATTRVACCTRDPYRPSNTEQHALSVAQFY